jgi:hypothetical protein
LVKNSTGKQLKETHKTLNSLGMTYGTQIKIEIGAPLREGIYTVKIAWVKLVDATAEYADNRFFYKEELDKIDIKPDENGEELKQKCLTLYN